MLRYHKQVYFDPQDTDRLKAFTSRLNGLSWRYSIHSIDSIKDRAIDLEGLLLFIKDIVLRAEQIFEYYADDTSREIIKACYRISWLKDIDIILCLEKDKKIISIWLNSVEDKHETLKRELYING
jgi:phosphorylcholine metabolism protein LicD